MENVYELSGQFHGGYLTTCRFMVPTKDGASPKPIQIPLGMAQQYVQRISTEIGKMRDDEFAMRSPLQSDNFSKILPALTNFGIKPFGKIVIGNNTDYSQTTAGSVIPMMRLIIVRPDQVTELNVLVHESVHLSGLGPADNFAVLLEPTTLKPSGVRVLNSAWRKVVSAPVVKEHGRWDFNDNKFIWRGLFFEEAMAELVEIFLLRGIVLLPKPVIFKGKDLVFEVPIEYGHGVAGWGMLVLDSKCPGVVKAILDGVSGNASYEHLSRIIESTFPGLFDQLYRVSHADGLAYGTELILKHVAGNG